MIYGVGFAVGLGLHAITGDRIGGRPAMIWGAVVLIIVGLALAGGAVARFVKAGTTIIPHHQVSHLVTMGPYRLSRNPMYSGLALTCVGGAIAIDTWWPLLTLIPTLLAIRFLVIGPEERYLVEAFGTDFTDYAQRVRRWL